MYNFTKEQLVNFYVNVLGYSHEEAESCTVDSTSSREYYIALRVPR